MYAGRDGNVYRRDNGTWQKYDNGNWSNTPNQPSGERPTPSADRAGADRATTTPSQRPNAGTAASPTVDQLNRDASARSEGTQRTKDYSSYKGSTGTGGTGSYRSGGATRSSGASRGGGGRRR